VFAIDDTDEESFGDKQAEPEVQVVNTDTWLGKPDILHKYKCSEVNNGNLLPA
jgi:hypothetical protein